MADGLVQRVNAKSKTKEKDAENDDNKRNIEDDEEYQDKYMSKRPKLTLMEELLMLSFRDEGGDTFLINDTVSFGIRACIFVELAMRKKIELEPIGARKRSSEQRNLVVINNSITGDPILDEALRIISESSESDSVSGWLNLLSGETWNLFQLKYHMRNVRSRICKGLVEKGICSTSSQNFFVVNITCHPLVDTLPKRNLITYINDLLTKRWISVEALNHRDFALISLTRSCDIIEKALVALNDSDYETAWSRLKKITDMDPEKEILKLSQTIDDTNKHDYNVKQVIFACLAAIQQL
ncbi:hypothetical protein MXB_3149 [Myxobolus squamalis]|nr:hypothetical protein MXB_3149 [Myxobolus squamalis]